ncbi:uncharacterized protein FRV6_11630 [Fusarium oxysporum]|uniref:Uncharacterized protein n=1 Tax=Fusarium oxysporum TaxID=5507 RepID=A0A2H3TFM7_FUSOX|nr:uncharacterized protein FRV6_11630 [Fusarium oxysporum]
MPCTRCFRAGKKCLISADSARCKKKLENNEDEATLAASRLSRIRKIHNHIKEKHSKATRRGLQEVDQQDAILSGLDAHKDILLRDLQVDHVPNDIDWSALGLGDNFLNASFLFKFSESSLGVARH